ncbi:MAG: Holliday junction resolvase RuvX [Anaerotignum sp.]|nr:Holliday junction resolvase RuvX [Anaerotignum sp.]
MRILGLDYGDKTIGVAVSDPFGWTAQGVEIIRRETPEEYKKSLRRLAELMEEYQAETIVLGYPKNLDNSEGERCEKTKVFFVRLQNRFPKAEVILWDERFSTVAAERSLREAQLSHDKRKSVIDKMAAVHILQGYLDSRNRE